MNQSPKKKHYGGRIILGILLALLIAAGIACYLLRDVISLAYYALTTPKDVVQSQQVENDKKTNELLNELIPEVTMRDLTEEERAKLAGGELSYADALALIRGETVAPATTEMPLETTAVPVETTAPEEPVVTVSVTTVVSDPMVPTTTKAEPVATTVETTAKTAATTAKTTETTKATTTKDPVDSAALQRRQEEIIAEIYLLRATYLNEIDQLIKDTKKAYIALPKEQKTLKKKMQMVEQMIPKGNQLERECDAKMETLLTELTGILKELGKSTQIINEIRKAYEEQKTLKLAELYSQYGSHLQE